jgi:hypothetical protein
MSNSYTEIGRDTEAARKGVMPDIANRPAPSQAFNQGHDGREAAQSREVTNPNAPRKE